MPHKYAGITSCTDRPCWPIMIMTSPQACIPTQARCHQYESSKIHLRNIQPWTWTSLPLPTWILVPQYGNVEKDNESAEVGSSTTVSSTSIPLNVVWPQTGFRMSWWNCWENGIYTSIEFENLGVWVYQALPRVEGWAIGLGKQANVFFGGGGFLVMTTGVMKRTWSLR